MVNDSQYTNCVLFMMILCCITCISLSLSLTLRQTQHTAGSESTGGATTAAASVKMISSGRISRAATKQRPFYTQGGYTAS